MRKAAQTALRYNEDAPKSRRWGTSTGLARARAIATGKEFNESEITQIVAFLKRFQKDYERQRDAKKYGKGYYAYLGWGGPSGIAWGEDKLRRYEAKKGRYD